MSSKAKDPLKAAAEREVLRKSEEAKVELSKSCKHPNVHFQRMGSRIRCVDCKRYWIAGWVGPKGHETDISDYGYKNPAVLDTDFRHDPNESPRRAPIEKKPTEKKIR